MKTGIISYAECVIVLNVSNRSGYYRIVCIYYATIENFFLGYLSVEFFVDPNNRLRG